MLAAVLAASLSLPAGLPPSLQIDGDLAEWSSRPVTIEQFHQVAGARRVSPDADFSARVWIAFTREGLALAGEVRDDHVLLPAGDKDRLTADHVELWLAFPEAKIKAPKVKDCAPPHWNDHPSQADCSGRSRLLWTSWTTTRGEPARRLFSPPHPGAASETGARSRR